MTLQGQPQPHRKDYTTVEATPLHPRRLAAIWRSLPEQDRFPFLLALTEESADTLIALTYDKPAADTRSQ
jgi:hypothetical protein